MKQYTINDQTFTLSPVTPKRLAKYCSVIGITDAKQFTNPEFISELGVISFNISISVEKCNELLAACLVEDTSMLDAGDLPVELIDGISNDFFSQRFGSLPKLSAPVMPQTMTAEAETVPSSSTSTSGE